MAEWKWGDRLAVALACLAGIMALALVWMDRNPVGAGITIGCMLALIVYPAIHFVRSWTTRVVVLVLAWVIIGIFGWSIWPHHSFPDTPLATEKQSQQQPPPPNITQDAKDSFCSNIVATDAKIKCEQEEKKKNGKPRP